jgi:uncharacterized protein (TIGR02246 family)
MRPIVRSTACAQGAFPEFYPANADRGCLMLESRNGGSMSTSIEEIQTTLNRFCDAWKSNDGTAVGSFFSDDGTLINPFGERADGRAAVTAMYFQYFGGMLRGTSTAFKLAIVRTVENNHAFVDADQTINGSDGSVVLVVHLAALLRREAGAWRLVDARPYVVAAAPA